MKKELFGMILSACLLWGSVAMAQSLRRENGGCNMDHSQYEESDTTEYVRLDSKKLWEEANKYRASVTDTTFLQTKGAMSDQAIDALTPDGWNNNYACNQVVYLKALARARKYLSLKDNQLVCNLKSGKDIRIAEDLYTYILTLFDDWNKWVKEGRCRIVKDEEGVYEVVPVRQGR